MKKAHEDLKKLPSRIDEIKDKGECKELVEKYEKLKAKYAQIQTSLITLQKESKTNLARAEQCEFNSKRSQEELAKCQQEAKEKDQIIDDIYG